MFFQVQNWIWGGRGGGVVWVSYLKSRKQNQVNFWFSVQNVSTTLDAHCRFELLQEQMGLIKQKFFKYVEYIQHFLQPAVLTNQKIINNRNVSFSLLEDGIYQGWLQRVVYSPVYSN